MKPIREEGYYYFILSDDDRFEDMSLNSGFGSTLSSIHRLVSDEEFSSMLELVIPPHIEFSGLDNKTIGRVSFMCRSKFVSIENVFDYKPYSGDTEFTIGSSKRSESPNKYLVKLHLDDDVIAKFSPTENSKDMIFANSIRVIINNGLNYTYTIQHRIDFTRLDTKYFENLSYDKLYKYYTLLC